MRSPLIGKQVETYVCADGDNPIEVLVEGVLKDPKRKERILASGDPRKAVEVIKTHITLRRHGQGENASWMYMAYIPQFDLHLRILTGSRLAENVKFNPF